MRIVTLIENLVYQNGLVAEHGLSIYIETENCKILFDTGQSGLFLQNAFTLGIKIEEIESLVLSHGHYDHTGGLYSFLEKNSKAKIYAKNSIFTPKYSGNSRFIGTPENEERLNNRMIYVDSITEIAENIFIVTDIPISNSIDTHFNGMYKKADGNFIPDEFDDELFLLFKHNNKINIITACSHRGITNICKTATEHFDLPIGLILGGLHMKNSTIEQNEHLIQFFRQIQPESLGVCHCTGIERFAELRKDLESDVFYNFTGNEVVIK